jgi:hypothetical protein
MRSLAAAKLKHHVSGFFLGGLLVRATKFEPSLVRRDKVCVVPLVRACEFEKNRMRNGEGEYSQPFFTAKSK